MNIINFLIGKYKLEKIKSFKRGDFINFPTIKNGIKKCLVLENLGYMERESNKEIIAFYYLVIIDSNKKIIALNRGGSWVTKSESKEELYKKALYGFSFRGL